MVDAVTTADSDGEYGNQICGDVSKLWREHNKIPSM